VDWFEEKFGDFADGVRMLRNSLRFLFQHPETLLPLIIVWLLSVYFVFEVLPRVPWQTLEWPETLLIVYLLNCGLCLLQLIDCSILLELLQHIETGKQLMMAELYLWVRATQWDDFALAGDTMNRHYSEQGVVPSLFNGVPDLLDRRMVKSR
jgi:hypothetical protein